MKIPNPCPVVLSRLDQQKDGSFFCKGCQKQLIDFREKSQDDIQACAGRQACGIFRAEQLTDQKRYSGWNYLVFCTLTLLSLMGFTVKPMQAQTTEPTGTDSVFTEPILIGEFMPEDRDTTDLPKKETPAPTRKKGKKTSVTRIKNQVRV